MIGEKVRKTGVLTNGCKLKVGQPYRAVIRYAALWIAPCSYVIWKKPNSMLFSTFVDAIGALKVCN